MNSRNRKNTRKEAVFFRFYNDLYCYCQSIRPHPDCGKHQAIGSVRFHRNFTYPLSDLIACDVFTLGR